MFKYLIVSIAITYASAGNLGLAGGYGGVGLGVGGLGLAGGYGGYGLGGGLVNGAVGLAGPVGGVGLGVGGLGKGLALGGVGLGGVGLGGGLGYAGGLGLGVGGLAVGHAPGPLPAAIQSRRTYEVRPVLLPQEPAVPQIIEVEPSEQPVQVVFRSISSPVLVQQIHTPGAPGQVEATQSEDEPHRVVHEVLRPVIQEVREVIQPFRRVTQEVRPVLEEVHTVVAKGERIRGNIAPVAAAVGPVVADAGLVDAGPIALGNAGLVKGGLGLGLKGGLAYAKSAKKAKA